MHVPFLATPTQRGSRHYMEDRPRRRNIQKELVPRHATATSPVSNSADYFLLSYISQRYVARYYGDTNVQLVF